MKPNPVAISEGEAQAAAILFKDQMEATVLAHAITKTPDNMAFPITPYAPGHGVIRSALDSARAKQGGVA